MPTNQDFIGVRDLANRYNCTRQSMRKLADDLYLAGVLATHYNESTGQLLFYAHGLELLRLEKIWAIINGEAKIISSIHHPNPLLTCPRDPGTASKIFVIQKTIL